MSAFTIHDLTDAELHIILNEFTEEELQELKYDWTFWARKEQRAPVYRDWTIWLILAGRGFGKTRSGAEFIRDNVEAGTHSRIALIGATAGDARDVMVEGESGLLACCPPWNKPIYEPSKRRLTWPNGALATLYSAEEADRLRGPQHDCFVAGTIVQAAHGDAEIESLRVGDLVVTRDGLRPVYNARSHVATVGTVRFSDGSSLTGTAQHPILTPYGWTSLSDLTIGSHVCTGKRHRTAISRRTWAEERFTSTDGCGSRPTGRSHQAHRCITATKTRETIASKTSRSWQRASTALSTPRLPSRSPLNAIVAASRASVASEQRACPVAPALSVLPMQGDRKSRDAARIVARHFNHDAAHSAVSVVSTWAPGGDATVYNLSVSDLPEFVANGIIVHNCAWADEVAAWTNKDAWDQLMMGLRLGPRPQVVATTTPRPIELIRDIIKRDDCVITRGRTKDNEKNLAPAFLKSVVAKYQGTRIGRQELEGELLDDVPGALWTNDMIETTRLAELPCELSRIVVGIDPAVTSHEDSDETGIIVGGLGSGALRNHVYILDDRSGQHPAIADDHRSWPKIAVAAYQQWHADRIVAERNNGGDLVAAVIITVDRNVPVTIVWASRGHAKRAEPAAMLWEQKRAHLIGRFDKLEDEMTKYQPDDPTATSPNRMDAMVWVCAALTTGDEVVVL